MNDRPNPNTLENAFLIPNEKLAVFIDGSNFFATFRSLNFMPDYALLRKLMYKYGKVLRMYYYTALHQEEDGNIKMQNLVDYLSYNGYIVVTKRAKEYVKSDGLKKIKGNMDIEMAVHAMEMAEHVDHIILFTGDGDFRVLVEALQRKGVRVTVISSIVGVNKTMADELRKQADNFVDLVTFKDEIASIKRGE